MPNRHASSSSLIFLTHLPTSSGEWYSCIVLHHHHALSSSSSSSCLIFLNNRPVSYSKIILLTHSHLSSSCKIVLQNRPASSSCLIHFFFLFPHSLPHNLVLFSFIIIPPIHLTNPPAWSSSSSSSIVLLPHLQDPKHSTQILFLSYFNPFHPFFVLLPYSIIFHLNLTLFLKSHF